MRAIEMIAWFTEDGTPRPIKFRMRGEDGTYIVVKIDGITEQREEKFAGNRMFIFTCQSLIRDIERIYEIKYELSSCKWYLFKF